jgi:hypothetical protein
MAILDASSIEEVVKKQKSEGVPEITVLVCSYLSSSATSPNVGRSG